MQNNEGEAGGRDARLRELLQAVLKKPEYD